MGSRSIHVRGSISIMAATFFLLGAGCKVDPKFNDESVACEADSDCEHLPGALFECDTDAGLCVWVGNLCDPPCPDPLSCVNGSCEIKLGIDEPAKGSIVGESFLMRGTALWLDNGAELVVQCKHGHTGTYEDADSVISGAPNQEGLIESNWECELQGSGEGDHFFVYVKAHAGSSKGSRTWELKQDMQAPQVDVQVLLEDGHEGTVYKPQEVTLQIEVRDYLGPDGDHDGEVTQVIVVLSDPEGATRSFSLGQDQCEGLGSPAASCELKIEFFSDLMAEGRGEPAAIHGGYSVKVTALDAVGNEGIGRGHFEVDREPQVAIWLRDIDTGATKSPDPEGFTVKRDGSFEIQVRVEKLEQMAKDEGGDPIVPRLKIGNPVFGSDENSPEDDWREVPLDPAPSTDHEVGRWSASLESAELDLFAIEHTYPIAAVIEDAWSHDPQSPREHPSIACLEADRTRLVGAACSSVRITRKKWEPVTFCVDQDDTQGQDCQVLTPAVDERGGVFVGVNSRENGPRLFRIDPEASEPSPVWYPDPQDAGRALLDGPVAHTIDGSDTQVYLWVAGDLVAVDGYPGVEDSSESQLWREDDRGGHVRWLPAIGNDNRLYMPIQLP